MDTGKFDPSTIYEMACNTSDVEALRRMVLSLGDCVHNQRLEIDGFREQLRLADKIAARLGSLLDDCSPDAYASHRSTLSAFRKARGKVQKTTPTENKP
jgi:hypothetical protein